MNTITEFFAMSVAKIIAAIIGALTASAIWFLLAWLFPSFGFTSTIAIIAAVIGGAYGLFVSEE